MSSGYEMYAGRDDEDALALLTASEYGHLTAAGSQGASLGPSFVHYAPQPAAGEIWLHLANNNPLLEVLESQPQAVLTVSGPSAYIPSHWLDSPYGVPTSYYSWARFEAEVTLLRDAEEIMTVLKAMLERFQPEGEHPAMALSDAGWKKMLGAITGLRLTIRSARSRFKYGQNRSAAVREGIVQKLRERGGPQDGPAAEKVLERMQANGAGEVAAKGGEVKNGNEPSGGVESSGGVGSSGGKPDRKEQAR